MARHSKANTRAWWGKRGAPVALPLLGVALVWAAVAGGVAGAQRAQASVPVAPAPSLGTVKACRAFGGLPPAGAAADQVKVPAGTFVMGSDSDYPEEAPARSVKVGAFMIDRYDVTNAQFARFVAATGYRTLAERGLDPARYPGVPAAMTRPGSTVFLPPKDLLVGAMQWWHYLPGADWRHPDGPDSSIEGLDNHPVVQIAYEDAQAYAKWLGRDLPTEAEYEYAAHGGKHGVYPWGDTFALRSKAMANTWQGAFPFQNTDKDGFVSTSPVGCFPANGYGLYDMVGNVWQWVKDPWQQTHAQQAAEPPPAPAVDLEDALVARARGTQFGTIKGGSFLCSPIYCKRYRPSARHAQDLTMGTNHIGFRTVSRLPAS
ncbi:MULTISPECIES: formylglycine-generating enzyme family protein [unclassified Paraburkholderia]|uniref:formylglycine-generating enzyme family protein n=1 Tax=unclassified Paraburkholderia TaxID=2615204 RepID=UPI002AB21C6A|nr:MULTISPECIES: formylglycine-generating enzyme family protein [unclassified Paraburkholderia]